MAIAWRVLILMTTAYLLLSFVTVAYAQDVPVVFGIDPEASISIVMDPQNPGPNETVHLTVRGGSLIDLAHSTITWIVNGKTLSKGTGVDSVDLNTGSLGQQTDVQVQAYAPDGSLTEASASIIPTHIDLLIDSDSYTPPFYRGRALPSVGTQLHLQALTYFKRADGSYIPPSSIVYTWKQNGQVAGNKSGKGRQTITLPSPALFGTDTITVDAVSTDGSLRGTASVRLSSVEPLLLLYEDHPLFGILFHKAAGEETSIPDSEATFAAVPYFIQAQTPADPRLRYSWSVNGERVASDAKQPDKLTINADRSQGTAAITLSVSHTSNVFINTKGNWNISFKTISQTNNPFSAGF